MNKVKKLQVSYLYNVFLLVEKKQSFQAIHNNIIEVMKLVTVHIYIYIYI